MTNTSSGSNIQPTRRTPSEYLVWISGAWLLTVMIVVTLQAIGFLPPAYRAIELITGENIPHSPSPTDYLIGVLVSPSYIIIMLIVAAIHAIVMRGIRGRKYVGAIIATFVLALLTYLASFTVGIYFAPSVVILIVAIGLSMMQKNQPVAA